MMADITIMQLTHGAHDTREAGVCLLEAVAYLGGEPHTDHPECACLVLAAYGRRINDAMGEGAAGDAYRARYLADLAPRLVGTRSTPEVEVRRVFVLADHAVRVIAPLALDAVGRVDEAARLRALAPVVDQQSAQDARDAACSLRTTRTSYTDEVAVYSAYGAAAAAAAAADDDAAARAAAAAGAADTAYAADYAARVADPDTVWAAARAAFVAALEVTDD